MTPRDATRPRADSEQSDLARQLDAADRDHRPLPRPGRVDCGLEDAYAVQRAFVDLRSTRLDSPPAAYKVALTSAAARAAVGAEQPASGVLLGVDVRPTGAQIPRESLFAPLVEVELVFRLARDLPAGADVDAVLAGCQVAGALECPDGRYQDWFGGAFPALSLPSVVADNCLAGLLVLGSVWREAGSLDLRAVSASVLAGDEVVVEGDAGNVLDHPASSVVWLNDHLRAQGSVLRAGCLVSAGTLTAPLPFAPGTVRARLSHGLGEVVAAIA